MVSLVFLVKVDVALYIYGVVVLVGRGWFVCECVVVCGGWGEWVVGVSVGGGRVRCLRGGGLRGGGGLWL